MDIRLLIAPRGKLTVADNHAGNECPHQQKAQSQGCRN
jgi:hypothetical protein